MTDNLRIVIVEDEYYVRKGLINSFSWQDIGCEIVGEADNGANGLKVIMEQQPHLVIADIEMPLLDGISMVEQLIKQGYKGEYIFLTSHQNFSYVYRALKLEVVDYLLKPFKNEELQSNLEKVKVKVGLNQTAVQETVVDEINFKNTLIRQAVLYVRENYAQEITSNSVAEYLNISSAYFCRTFKKETGYTFGHYLAYYRIHKAAHLLQDSDMRISEVAAACGIADSNYFSQIFKKIKGVTPKEYQSNRN